MKPEIRENSAEVLEAESSNPPVESFLNPASAVETWPENVANHEAFLEQIAERKELSENLNEVFDKLPRPDMSFELAISEGHITEAEAEKAYNSVSKLLASGQDAERLVLYLPFEMMPDDKWKPTEKGLQEATDDFRVSYVVAWKNLLDIHDVKANFVNGDISEEQQRGADIPRVVKAAHLIPKMIEKGWMDAEDALLLIKTSEDEILRQSIADTLPVLVDLGFIGAKELKDMEKSDDSLIKKTAKEIEANKKEKEPDKKAKPILTGPSQSRPEASLVGKPEVKKITLPSLEKDLAKKFSKVEGKKYKDVTKKREAWLRAQEKQGIIEDAEDDISTAIVEGLLTDKAVAEFITADVDVTSQQALIGGIRKSIEATATAGDTDKAQTLYDKYQETLLTIWQTAKPEAKEALTKTFCRLNKLGVVADSQLTELNIVIPNLVGPFSENLKTMEKEMQEIRGAIASIENNPELSRLVYPVALVFGSRLKGYGKADADIDVGVFVKPGTLEEERKNLQRLLKETFGHEKIQGEVVEFWLEDKDGGLAVKNFDKQDPALGEDYFAHILFGAAYEGDKKTMQELREKLLVPYMYETDETSHGLDARELYLAEMERDTLQYRLMHKGYERFNPQFGGINTAHADKIDGKSMFYDSGYRQLATKLFASKVFLPKIPKPAV